MFTSVHKGCFNQHIVCMSDYLLIPAAPEYFSYEAAVRRRRRWGGALGGGERGAG